MQIAQTVYEGENIKVVECVDEDGDLQRQLLLGPPFENPQGIIKASRPKFHVQPFTRNLTYGAVCVPGGVESALFLGLGAGVVIQAVRDLFPAAGIDIVEINAELFSISNEYFFRIDAANVRWFAEDASNFIKNADRRYDYICCDIWGHHLEAPQFLVERDFISSVKNSIGPRGVFAVSTQWFLHKQMTEMLASEFAFVFSIRAPTCMLLATNARPKEVTDDKLMDHLRSNNLDVSAIRANSMLIRSARAGDFDAQADHT